MGDTAFVLIVNGEVAEAKSLAETLGGSRFACHVVEDPATAVESVRDRPPDVIVADWNPRSKSGSLELLREAKQLSRDTEVILLTPPESAARLQEAVAADAGLAPFEILTKPFDPERLRREVSAAARQAVAAREARLLRQQVDEAFEFYGIIGSSEIMRREIKRLTKIARSKSTVLLVGETGTGKELFAQAIHLNSLRSNRPFKVLNCAAVSETLLESELFGHVKGAFTGAVADRKGLIQAADAGTLFLDEIGDMPLSMQAKLLRTLDTGEVIPVGTNDTLYFDVRFVAATNRELSELVRSGTFREDLFYRLHAHGAIRLPPLRHRRDDIPVLTQRFIEQANKEQGTSIQRVSPEVMRRFINFHWPGNVRELRNVIFRMCVEAEGPVLNVGDLPDSLKSTTDIVPAGPPNLAGMTMADVERLHIMNTLRMFGGNREKTAKALGIGARTLYRKLRDYGLR